MEIKEKIKEAFKQVAMEMNRVEVPVARIEQKAELEAGTFHKHYASVNKLAEAIFVEYFAKALDMARADEIYADYIARQKLLAFYYSLIEVMKPDRTFIDTLLELRPFYERTPAYMVPLKSAFLGHIKALIEEGIAIEEVEARIKLADFYADPHWYQFLFIISFWTGDESEAFEKTDEAIEKSVNLGFDLMGRNVLDTTWEFGKFWWKNRD